MKRIRFNVTILFIIFVSKNVNAQTLSFTDITHSFFSGVNKGNIEFVDVDGDNDMDILTTGYDANTTNLYINNGNGIFAKDLSIPFSDMYRSKFALADLDNDNDIDIIISGKPGGFAETRIYENNGNGGFSIVSTTIPGFIDPFIKTADVDNDGYIDFYIHGRSIGGTLTTKLYKNDGNLGFVEISNSFPQYEFKDAEFSDIDGDNDMDILMIEYVSGWNPTFTPLLFVNNGNGSFTQIINSFPNTDAGYLIFGDIDGDNDEDVVIGREIYINNGSGIFSSQSQLLSSYNGKFADLDNDGDIDYIGANGNFDVNDGNGNFSLTSIIAMEEASSLDIADVNNDGLKDIFSIGHSAFGNIAKLYINHGNSNFSEHLSKTPFRWLYNGDIDVGDINGDASNDIIITGFSKGGDKITFLYTNTGDGDFLRVINTPFKNFGFSKVKMLDVDNDSDLDIFITGTSDVSESIIYKNDGSGNFTEFPTNIIGKGDNINFFDFEGDGDKDLFIIQSNVSTNHFSKLYLNDGNGNYVENTNHPFPSSLLGDVEFFDIDNDGDIDALFSGWTNGVFKNTFVYENDGNQNFTLNSNTGIAPLGYSNLLVADVDGDGFKDVYIAGSDGTPNNYIPYAKIYHNNGNGTFSELSDWTNVNVAFNGSFIDIDNDSDLDLFLSGNDLYINNGNGAFNQYTGFSFQHYVNGIGRFVDIDGDNDLDLLQYGKISNYPFTSATIKVIKNNYFDNSSNIVENVFSSLKIYPNPTNSMLNISNESGIEITNIKVFNTIGKQVIEQGGTASIDLSKLNNGLYFINVENSNGEKKFFKIIKK